jgi:hypothetical protein
MQSPPQNGVKIPWPSTTGIGNSPAEDRGRLINTYAEPLGEDEILWRRVPGCAYFGQQTTQPWTYWGLELQWFNQVQGQQLLPTGLFRGAIFVQNVLYVVLDSSVYTYTSSGSATKIGSVAGSDKVFLAHNNAFPVQDILCVCQAGAFTFTNGIVANYTDINVGSPSCVVGHKGFLIFGYGNSDMLSTNINTTVINPLNLARTEGNPDGVVQMISYSGQLYVFGLKTIEVWGDPVNGTGFPFNRTAYNITPGITNDHAVAGWEPEFGSPPIYVGEDNSVRWLINDSPVDITPRQLKRNIQKTGVFPLEVLVYNVDGVPFCEISGPYPSSGLGTFTWVFDCMAGSSETEPIDAWHERVSYLQTRSRFTGSVFAFGQWLCGDMLQSGYLLQVGFQYVTEGPNPLIAEIHSLPVEQFPVSVACPRADFEFTTGIGIAAGHQPDQTDPQVDCYWSDDASNTWNGPRLLNLGQQSNARVRVSTFKTGLSGPQGRRWRLTLPAAVRMGFAGGTMKAPIGQY